MKRHTFLVEIGTEELPPKILRSLAEAFTNHISREFSAANICYGALSWFATPRRLAIKVINLNSVQTNQHVEKRGPTITQAFDISGNPTKIARSWAHSIGITMCQAERLVTDKGEWLIYRAQIKGQLVQKVLCAIVSRALNKLPIPKMMRWGNKEIKFIRPVHTVTLLLDNVIIPGNILGINIDRILYGHRFMGEQKITLERADDYPQVLLTRGKVIANYFQRKKMIFRDAKAAAKRLGGIADLSNNLLEEVTSLVEWPIVLTARFEKKFLMLPIEVIVCIIKNKQKYFPVYDNAHNLLPYFIFVANIESRDSYQVISGNEKVVHSYLADAEFFLNIDRKQRLEERLPQLSEILFQKQLGTLRDKSERIEVLAAWISIQIGANVPYAARAGLLSKCDLTTNMVREFTSTQGVIGMHYARHDGEPEEVALAQKEHYYPRFPEDTLPTTQVSCAVAIADKMDTLVGIFGIGFYPKGNADPFALRRATLGVIRIILEKQLSIDLKAMTEEAARVYNGKLTNDDIIDNVINFMFDRLRSWYQERGYSVDIVQAVMAQRPTLLIDFDARIRAISFFRTLSESKALIESYKRVSNILSKANFQVSEDLQISILRTPEEINLAIHVARLCEKLKPLFKNGHYHAALMELVMVRESLDSFFNNVLVMVSDDQLRINRLTLLTRLHQLFLKIADFSLLR